MKLIYRKLFDLHIWHNFYLGNESLLSPDEIAASYDVRNDFSISPTAETRQLMANYRMRFKSSPKGGSVYIEIDANASENETFIPIDQPISLRFFLIQKGKGLLNYTLLPLSGLSGQMYYFSNLANNNEGALFLSQPLAIYSNGNTYPLGSLVKHSGQIYEAIIHEASGGVNPDPSDWIEYADTQYVTASDLYSTQSPIYSFSDTGFGPSQSVEFVLKDIHDQPVYAKEVETPADLTPADTFNHQLSFKEIPAGKYTLEVDGNLYGDAFCLIDPLRDGQAFGLIEIAHHSSIDHTNYGFVEISGAASIASTKDYIIRFKNRSTRWKYIYADEHGYDAPTLIANDFELLDLNSFVSANPLPLLKKATNPTIGLETLLPIPELNLIKPELDTAQNTLNIYSEIYL